MAESNAHNGAMLSPEATQIETYSGKFVDTLNPDPETIDARDIAHHLSQTCRFGGATSCFYSVAEHAVLVYDLMRYRGARGWALDGALLHDAAEAYLGDVVSPLKYALRAEEFYARRLSTFDDFDGTYATLSGRMDSAIAERFGVPERCLNSSDLRVADMWALRIEAERLTSSRGANWRWPGELPDGGKLPERVRWIGGLPPNVAEVWFLQRLSRQQLVELSPEKAAA